MKYGICILSIVPVRAEPKDPAELVTQLLFGDLIEILDQQNQWLKIKNAFDSYVGWIDEKQIQLLKKSDYDNAAKIVPQTFYLPTTIETTIGKIIAPVGSSYHEHLFSAANINPDSLSTLTKQIKKQDLLNLLDSFLNAPYLWGGKTINGIDCSGFTQVVYKILGLKLLRDASQQVLQGEDISLNKMQTGDLVFFNNDQGKITHVGIVHNAAKIIHASGRVRIDELRAEGIYNSETKTKTHQFHSIKRHLTIL